jgi:hypothetical protein
MSGQAEQLQQSVAFFGSGEVVPRQRARAEPVVADRRAPQSPLRGVKPGAVRSAAGPRVANGNFKPY